MRVLFLLLFMALFLAHSGQAQEETQEEQRPATGDQAPSQDTLGPLRVIIVEDKAAADARERREAKSQQNEADDLIAQQGMNLATQAMNEATQRMALYNKVSTILVGIGTALLLVTLWFTMKANQAAQNAVTVTREVGQAQIRAYLGITSINFGEYENTHDPVVRYRVSFKLKNFGQSLASEVCATTQCTVDGRVVNAIAHKKESGTLCHHFGIINPNHSPEGLIDIGKITSVPDFRVIIKITYTDAFDRRWLHSAEYFPIRDDGPSGGYKMSVFPGTSHERRAA